MNRKAVVIGAIATVVIVQLVQLALWAGVVGLRLRP